jgi:hypothetical protein
MPLENAGFERGKPGEAPDGWANGGGYAGYPATIATDNPHSGRQCALLRTDPSARVRDYGGLSQMIDTAPLRKRSIRLRLFARTATEADGRPAVFYRIDREGDQKPIFANRVISGNEWREYAMDVDVPNDAIRMQFGVTLSGDGRVWVDDASLAIMGNSPIQTKIPADFGH